MSEGSIVARKVRIYGRVQGVFFRDSLRRLAARLGVSGWVRNRPDGAVEAHLEGSPEAVAELIEYCHKGPPAARVERVQIEDAQASNAEGFRILR